MSKIKMYGYKVIINQYMVDSYQSEEEWGAWSSSSDNSFERIEKIYDDKYPDVVSIEDLQVGDECFVVWAEWSSGDSFGHVDGSNVEAIAVFSKEEDANDMKKELLIEREGYEYSFTASTGQRFENKFAGWKGYFESLDEIHVERTTIKDLTK